MARATRAALDRARQVRLMIFDVDGVLTDGRLWYGPAGESLKAFHSLDGHGVKMLAASGVPAAILSGRSSEAVSRRAAELDIEHVLQGIEDKRAAFDALTARLGLKPSAAGYMGDDLVDLPVLVRCGFACAPHEAPETVRRHAHYVSAAPAGSGAVREVCELVMRAQDTLERALAAYLA
jgi:3-deoxy-D-manno-octulosonate 8-phosphate phosphatase (KDO 8-P phosphatase)